MQKLGENSFQKFMVKTFVKIAKKKNLRNCRKWKMQLLVKRFHQICLEIVPWFCKKPWVVVFLLNFQNDDIYYFYILAFYLCNTYVYVIFIWKKNTFTAMETQVKWYDFLFRHCLHTVIISWLCNVCLDYPKLILAQITSYLKSDFLLQSSS